MSESADRRVAEARHEVRQVCDWLMRPSAETMAACAPALDRAVASIRELSVGAQPANTNRQDIQALTGEIHAARALLAAAGDLYYSRMRRLATPDPDHDSGSPPAKSISVTG